MKNLAIVDEVFDFVLVRICSLTHFFLLETKPVSCYTAHPQLRKCKSRYIVVEAYNACILHVSLNCTDMRYTENKDSYFSQWEWENYKWFFVVCLLLLLFYFVWMMFRVLAGFVSSVWNWHEWKKVSIKTIQTWNYTQ